MFRVDRVEMQDVRPGEVVFPFEGVEPKKMGWRSRGWRYLGGMVRLVEAEGLPEVPLIAISAWREPVILRGHSKFVVKADQESLERQGLAKPQGKRDYEFDEELAHRLGELTLFVDTSARRYESIPSNQGLRHGQLSFTTDQRINWEGMGGSDFIPDANGYLPRIGLSFTQGSLVGDYRFMPTGERLVKNAKADAKTNGKWDVATWGLWMKVLTDYGIKETVAELGGNSRAAYEVIEQAEVKVPSRVFSVGFTPACYGIFDKALQEARTWGRTELTVRDIAVALALRSTNIDNGDNAMNILADSLKAGGIDSTEFVKRLRAKNQADYESI